DYVNTPTPGGESYAQMIHRCKVFIEELKKFNQENICIVTHGGPIRAFKSILENTPPKETFLKNSIGYGDVCYMFL
ncbi:MAG: histidine phosphatase family protein, partial [Prolixibacteraceae bacterium]|nr:histidine phosphatase family protein [Prolixibacteraceae bacterium]